MRLYYRNSYHILKYSCLITLQTFKHSYFTSNNKIPIKLRMTDSNSRTFGYLLKNITTDTNSVIFSFYVRLPLPPMRTA